MLLNLLVFDMDLQAAIEAPRINSDHPHSSFDSHESVPGQLEVESRIPVKVLDDLRARGHDCAPSAPFGMSTGVVAVGVNPEDGHAARRRRPAPRALCVRLVVASDILGFTFVREPMMRNDADLRDISRPARRRSCATPRYAQDASVIGAVTDETKAVLPGVNVTATDLETGVQTIAVSRRKRRIPPAAAAGQVQAAGRAVRVLRPCCSDGRAARRPERDGPDHAEARRRSPRR